MARYRKGQEMKESIKILEAHNSWRRGDDSEQGSPFLIGMAIDDCLKAAKRYELIRTLNLTDLTKLWQRNIYYNENFDGMIDQMIKDKK
jgi:hypothetical protein